MKDYPSSRKHSGHFSHKYVRLLAKSCAAQDIGHHAVLLCVFIVHTEDAARYSGPVRFWNEQLMNIMGFRSPKQLDTARSRAMEAGWLEYDRAGNRTVGKYFVTVPNQFESLDDTPLGEQQEPILSANHSTNLSVIHSENGTNTGRIAERIAERIGDELRNESVTNCGKHSNPIPNPNPIPNTETHSVENSTGISEPKKPKRKRSVPINDPGFTRFWSAYPRREAKGNAVKAWAKAIAETEPECIILAAERFAKLTAGKEPQYIAHPATWLNARRWEDEELRPRNPLAWQKEMFRKLHAGEITEAEFNQAVKAKMDSYNPR